MTCSLMIYAALEHRIREELKIKQRSILDIKQKPTQTPTVRWVFSRFMGIHELTLPDTPTLITGIRDCAATVIDCVGRNIATHLFLKMLRNIGCRLLEILWPVLDVRY